MVGDLLPHALGLTGDDIGQRPRARGGLAEDDAERGLQAMGEVADVGALALDHLLVVGDQGVEFAGQGFELHRPGSRQPLGDAGAHGGDLAAQGEERLQADAHLDDHRGDEAGAQKHKGHGDGGGEGARVAIERGAVLGGDEHQRTGDARQAGLEDGHAQGLLERAASVVELGLADRPGQDAAGRHRRVERLVPQRARADDGVQGDARQGRGDLPVFAGKDAQGLGIGEGGGGDPARLIHRGAGQKALDDLVQFVVEASDGGVAEEGGERQARGDDHRQAPRPGQKDEAPDEGAAAPGGQPHAPACSPSRATRR